jgi:predicted RND superfamily exporter protein
MIIEKSAIRMVEIQVEHPIKVMIGLLLVTALILPGALHTEIKPSTEAVLPEDDNSVQALDDLRSKFYGDSTLIVFESEDVRTVELMKDVERIENRLVRKENIKQVNSPVDIVKMRYGEIPDSKDKLNQVDYRETVSQDYGTMVVTVSADTQANSDEIQKLNDDINQALETVGRKDQATLTGYNMIDLATFQVIIQDFIRITGVSFLAVMGVLYATFRDVKKMLLPLSVVMFGLFWMIGLGGWLGADLTIISMVSAAMIMGLGIDFGIHVTKKFYKTQGGQDGLSQTMVELSRGLVGASFTTAVGFLALLFAELAGMHSLGIFLFTGIIASYIGSTVMLPTLIILIEGKNSFKID